MLTLLFWPLEDGTFQGAKHQCTRPQTDAGSLTYDPVSAPPTPRAGGPSWVHTFSAPMLGHFQL